MAKKRVKSDKQATLAIADWQKADEYVRIIGELQMQITQTEQTATDDINDVKLKLAEEVEPRQAAIKLYIRSLEAFCETHRLDFKKKRSRKLNFGLLGWRYSTSIKTKKNTLERIKKVFSKAKAAAYIRVKEMVDKETLAKLTDGQLASVGARREEKDVFFVEPDLPEAVDYAE